MSSEGGVRRRWSVGQWSGRGNASHGGMLKVTITRRQCCGPLSNCSPAAPWAMSFHIGHIVLTHYSKVSLQNDVSLFNRALPQQIKTWIVFWYDLIKPKISRKGVIGTCLTQKRLWERKWQPKYTFQILYIRCIKPEFVKKDYRKFTNHNTGLTVSPEIWNDMVDGSAVLQFANGPLHCLPYWQWSNRCTPLSTTAMCGT